MSHIFDALQCSESEHAGTELPASTSITDLLRRAERRIVRPGDLEAVVENPKEPGLAADQLSSALKTLLPETSATGLLGGSGAVDADAFRDLISQLRKVEVSLSAQSRLVSMTENDSPAAEAFRLLRVRLGHLRHRMTLKKLLITSTSPQEGKSFAAANLACTIALGTDKRVLLLDGDLRRPALSKLFGIGPMAGISEWLQGTQPLTSSIYHLEDQGIWFLPAGSMPGNPLELIQSPKLPSLLDELNAWFDWIIIDSPPVLPMADTSIWARLADGILLVTRQGVTEKPKLQRGLEALEPSKLIGALLNSYAGTVEQDYYYYARKPSKPEAAAD